MDKDLKKKIEGFGIQAGYFGAHQSYVWCLNNLPKPAIVNVYKTGLVNRI